MKPIPYGRHNITQDDIDAVVEVLQSDFLTQGPQIAAFEKAFAAYVGSKYAVAVTNGTAALHLSALALGVKPGQKVITTPITFAASANCVRYAGGEVIFADIDPDTYILDINKVEEILKRDKNVVGIIPVDFAGRAVNLEGYKNLADKYECWILEDACHAPGGYFTDSKEQKQFCGNGNFADLAIFSFHPVKHIATGEGGMITSNDKKLYNKLQTLRTHGITKEAASFQNSIDIAMGNSSVTTIDGRRPNDTKQMTNDYPGWYYELQYLGFNYRLSDIHASLGISQIKRADKNLQRRREIAQKYYEVFKNIPQIQDKNVEAANSHQPTVNSHAYHLYIIEAEDRKGLYEHLRKNNIFTQVHYIPNHLQPYYRQQGWKQCDLPNAEKYYEKCLSIPMYHSMTAEEQDRVIKTIDIYYK
jgi:UDP-4-amino-4,6-dideoxy-N-acetyl-beta-L-altrosamine transaminase